MKKFGYFINRPYDILNSLYEIINLKRHYTNTNPDDEFSIPKFWKKNKFFIAAKEP